MRKFVVVDIETTGLSATDNKIIEIGAVKVENMEVVGKFSQLIYPEVLIPPFITELTGIENRDVMGQPTIDKVLPAFAEFANGYHLLGHNISFDYSFLKENATGLKIPFDFYGVDTVRLANRFITESISKSLTSLVSYYNLERESAHRAYDDAYATYQLYALFYERFYELSPGAFMPEKLTYKKRKVSDITASQKSYLTALMEKHHIIPEIPIEELSKSDASKEIDRIIRNYGR